MCTVTYNAEIFVSMFTLCKVFVYSTDPAISTEREIS